jgi:hypothetical protein
VCARARADDVTLLKLQQNEIQPQQHTDNKSKQPFATCLRPFPGVLTNAVWPVNGLDLVRKQNVERLSRC